ncbi:MAG: hypothetical protein WCN92_12210 [Eubacteriales bacterium]
MALLTIGSTAMPNPTKYTVKRADLDSENTTRDELGNLHRERVRAGAYVIDVAWQVTKAAFKTVVDALAPVSFSATFFDPNSASTATATMYAGDRTGDLLQYTDEAHPENSMWELSATLVQY